VGLALSDASGTLARPLATLTVSNAEEAIALVAREIARLQSEDDGLAAVVVGMPKRLDGSPNEQTGRVTAFIAALTSRTPLPVHTEDERLSSVEAESRLAIRHRSWRARKAELDAAAAAVILQDYLDRRTTAGGWSEPLESGESREQRESRERRLRRDP
jgi:putative Holliday junction resolvase